MPGLRHRLPFRRMAVAVDCKFAGPDYCFGGLLSLPALSLRPQALGTCIGIGAGTVWRRRIRAKKVDGRRLAESDNFATRLSSRVYDEIAPILRLPPKDPIECLTWNEISVQCVRCMRSLFDQAAWNELVEAELAAH